MKIFKLFMLPLAAFTLASAAAVKTDESRNSKVVTTTMIGGIHNPLTGLCDEVNVNCEPGEGDACLSAGWTVYGFDTPVTCNQTLRKI